MSAKISGKVWELDLKPTEKLVLLALADHADHEGENVHPGNDLLVAKTGLSQQTVTAAIATFIKDGILEPVSDKTGRGHLREFTLIPDAGSRRQFFTERERKKAQTKRTFQTEKRNKQDVPSDSENLQVEKVQNDRGKVQIDETKVQTHRGKVQNDEFAYKEYNRHEPSIEPSITRGSSPNPLLPLLIEAYKNIIRKPQDETDLQWQAEELCNAGVSVEELTAWLNWRRMRPAIRYIAEKVLLWRDDQAREKAKKNADAYVGSQSSWQNIGAIAAEVIPPAEAEPVPQERSGNWGLVLDLLDDLIPESAIKTWFEPLIEVRTEDGVLYLTTPHPSFRQFIEFNYADQLSTAVKVAGLAGVVFTDGKAEEISTVKTEAA